VITRAVRRTVLFLVALLLAAAAWELYKSAGPAGGGSLLGVPLAKTNDRVMPHTWTMIRRLSQPENRAGGRAIWRAVAGYGWYTFRLSLAGLLLGTVAGLAAAVVMARLRVLERGLLPWIVMSQTVPLIALAPQVVSWSGRIHLAGWEWPRWLSVSALAAFLAFFPIALGTLRGLKSAPPAALELMQSYAASWWKTLVKLRFPSAVPAMIPALKQAATLSVVGVIVSEISTGVKGGIGRAVISYSQAATGDPAKPYAAVVGAAVLGLVMYGLIVALDVALMRRRPVESETPAMTRAA
jgi:NitT/TauT family transport system permease protein